MKKEPHLRAPKIFKTLGVKEGDPVVVHILQDNQKFLHLSFKEKNDDSALFDKETLISYDLDKHEKDKEINQEFERIEQTILDLGGVYSSYNYLFTLVDNKLFLLSISVSNLALGFDAVKIIAEKIDVKTLKPSWKGTYTTLTWAAFVEDIFIQAV